jgi:hypothetical protein
VGASAIEHATLGAVLEVADGASDAPLELRAEARERARAALRALREVRDAAFCSRKFERVRPVETSAIDVEGRRVQIAISSETPVRRWFGSDILDHSPEAVRLDRLRAGAALLLDHWADQQIGVVEEFELGADRVLRAWVRFDEDALSERIFRGVVNGIRRLVSVGYMPHSVQLLESSDEGDTYLVNDWEPVEVSFVSVPADPSVGVGRSLAWEGGAMETETGAGGRRDVRNNAAAAGGARPAPGAERPEVLADRAREGERLRVEELLALGEQHGQRELARRAVSDGTAVAAFQGVLLERLRGAARPTAEAPEDDGRGAGLASALGVSPREVQRYSLIRAINAAATGD